MADERRNDAVIYGPLSDLSREEAIAISNTLAETLPPEWLFFEDDNPAAQHDNGLSAAFERHLEGLSSTYRLRIAIYLLMETIVGIFEERSQQGTCWTEQDVNILLMHIVGDLITWTRADLRTRFIWNDETSCP